MVSKDPDILYIIPLRVRNFTPSISGEETLIMTEDY